jgi:dTDP-4-amino-4,6-dideoxygalactose transaminase
MKQSVPFVDLAALHDGLRSELDALFRRTVEESAFIGGARVEEFERVFAHYCGVARCAAVSDGTTALYLALRAVGVDRGDLVLSVSHTFIATHEAILQCGADPVFIDVDPTRYTMDPIETERWLQENAEVRDGICVERASGRRICAIVPVHLYGLPADMEPLLDIAHRWGLKLVEDACQAHGAFYTFSDGRRRRAGAMGDAAAFSFYPGKNLGAMGEGGAVVSDDPAIVGRVAMLRDHGQSAKYVHVSRWGINGRLDTLQCGILSLKLPHLDKWNAQRRQAAARYAANLRDVAGLVLPETPANAEHVWHLYVVHVENRDQLRDALGAVGVQTGLHYPIPVHKQTAFADYERLPASLPVTERLAAQLLSLPMFPALTDAQVDYVSEQLRVAMRAAVAVA